MNVNAPSKKLRAIVVGATGIAGQQFLTHLRAHPWFEIVALAGSSRSAGKTYLEAITQPNGNVAWFCGDLPARAVLEMTVQNSAAVNAADYDVVFTAVESDAARELEPLYAATTPVFSTAAAFRMETDVPLLIPGVNDAHLGLIEAQRKARGWKGYVLPIPNCTTTGLAVTLKPLWDAFGLDLVVMTSMQAVSGAGRNGGVLSLDSIDNVIPYIPKEEEKVQRETQKILGSLSGAAIVPADFGVTCTCNRVGVLDGHTETVVLSLSRPATVDEARAAMTGLGSSLAGLPSAPERLIFVHDDPFRPQPRLDRDRGAGMVTTVGRLRADPVLKNGLKYTLVSHNTRMGAAAGATLLAELCVREGLLLG